MLAHGLKDLGLNVVVITTHQGPDHVGEEAGIRIHRLRPRNLYWVGSQDARHLICKIPWQVLDTWNPLMYAAVLRILRRESADLVHVHKLRGLSPSVWAAAHTARLRIVQTCRDYELISPDAVLSTRVGKLAERDAVVLRPYVAARAAMSSVVHAATAPSRYTLNKITDRKFFSKAHLQVIPNSHGCSSSDLRSRQEELPSGRAGFRILYLGRVEKSKGVMDLCEVVETLTRQFPDIALDVVGEGSERKALEDRFRGSPAIRFHGPKFHHDKDEFLRQCTVLVIPSRWPEVFGNVIPEAYSFGKPVIGANVGGIPEVIEEGRTGFLFEPGNLQQLRERISLLALRSDIANNMREFCFSAAANYTVEAIAQAYLSLYTRLDP